MEFKKRSLLLLLLLLLFSCGLGLAFGVFGNQTDTVEQGDGIEIVAPVDSSDEDVGWLLDMEEISDVEIDGDDTSIKTLNDDESDTGTKTDITEDEANGEVEIEEETDIETNEEVTEETEEIPWWEKWLLLLTNMFNNDDTEEVGTEDTVAETTTSSSSGGSSKVYFDYTDKTNEELEAMMNATVAESMVTISMNTNPVFENGTGKVLIYNDVQNKYPQIVEIYDENNQLIYQSGLIEVGSKVETATLLVDLATGDHNCIATFNVVDEQTGALVAKVNAEIVVSVK